MLGNKLSTIQYISVFGFANCEDTDELCVSAQMVAQRLVEEGYIIVNGGGPGVMKASTIGAKKSNGHVLGITFYPTDMTNYEGRDLGNDFDEEIKTNDYLDRTLALLREGQVYVFFNGGTGTISEFGMAWGLARLYFGHHKPLILYGKFWKNIIEVFQKNMRLRAEDLKVFKIVDSPEGVIKAIKDFEKEIAKGGHSHLEITRGDFTL